MHIAPRLLHLISLQPHLIPPHLITHHNILLWQALSIALSAHIHPEAVEFAPKTLQHCNSPARRTVSAHIRLKGDYKSFAVVVRNSSKKKRGLKEKGGSRSQTNLTLSGSLDPGMMKHYGGARSPFWLLCAPIFRAREVTRQPVDGVTEGTQEYSSAEETDCETTRPRSRESTETEVVSLSVLSS